MIEVSTDEQLQVFNTRLARYRMLAGDLVPGEGELKDALAAGQVVALQRFKAAGVVYEPGEPVNDLPLPALLTLSRPAPGEGVGKVTTQTRYEADRMHQALRKFEANALNKCKNGLSKARHSEVKAAAVVAGLQAQLKAAREHLTQCQAAREEAEQALLDLLATAPAAPATD